MIQGEKIELQFTLDEYIICLCDSGKVIHNDFLPVEISFSNAADWITIHNIKALIDIGKLLRANKVSLGMKYHAAKSINTTPLEKFGVI